MSDELHQQIGEIIGKLDALNERMTGYIESHDRRHEIIDTQVQQARDDINQAKGAKAAVLAAAGMFGGAIAFIAQKLLGK